MKIIFLPPQSMRTSAQNAAHQGREDVVVVSGLTDLLPSVTEQLIQNQLLSESKEGNFDARESERG
jgi:hypothetical protein